MITRSFTLGPLSVLYENGFLRYVRLGGREVLRMIYFALRDHNWDTLAPVIRDERIEQSAEGFSIRYVCEHYVSEQAVFAWRAHIRGHVSGEFVFEISGRALAEFRRNRAGFCVLHPIRETIGQPVTITHPDGQQTHTTFPEYIAPTEPFVNIQAMRWPVQAGVAAELVFAGDVFETEDQRNWTDASFKTFCTPLNLPRPVTLRPGDTVEQSVTLRLTGLDTVQARPGTDAVIRITVDETNVAPFPKIGAVYAAGQPLPAPADLDALRSLQFDHLRIDLNLTKPNWPETLQGGLAEANALSLPVELALSFGTKPETEWQTLLFLLNQRQPQTDVALITLYSAHQRATPGALLQHMVPLVRRAFPEVEVGAGSDVHFTDLNRNRFATDAVDYVSYAINPQIHAFDDRSLVENLAAQADTVHSARQFVGDRPLHVSPVTLRPRFNPEAIGELITDPAALPYDVDQRQATPFAATWLLGSLKYLSESGVERITIFETHGMKGYLMAGTDTQHSRFSSATPVFPVHDALQKVRALRPTHVLRSESSRPLVVSSWVLRTAQGNVVVLSNHTPDAQRVYVSGQMVELGAHAVAYVRIP